MREPWWTTHVSCGYCGRMSNSTPGLECDGCHSGTYEALVPEARARKAELEHTQELAVVKRLTDEAETLRAANAELSHQVRVLTESNAVLQAITTAQSNLLDGAEQLMAESGMFPSEDLSPKFWEPQ
jgi:hypothetical protein